MGDYIVPRVSVLISDMTIWTNLDRFSDLTGYIPEATSVTVIADQREKASALSRLFAAITCRGYQSRTSSQLADTLFDKSVHGKWRRDKDDIKALIKKHMAIMADLKRDQEKCFSSNDDVVRYASTIDLQTTFVKHYKVTEGRILADIEKMERECEKLVQKHARYYERFQKTLAKENACREKLQKLSATLEDDIVQKMTNTISKLMRETHQTTSVEEIRRLAMNILEMTSKLYHTKPPTRFPCGQDKILTPQLNGCRVSNLGAVKSQNVEKKAGTSQ